MKMCRRCSTTKEDSLFPVAKANLDGLDAWCYTCRATYVRERRRARGTPERRVGLDPAKKKATDQAYQERARVQRPELNRLRCARRNALKRNAPVVDLTESQWLEILSEYEHRCAYCGISAPLEQEHVIPLSRGGNHTRSNVVPACSPCNRRKYNKSASEFLFPEGVFA